MTTVNQLEQLEQRIQQLEAQYATDMGTAADKPDELPTISVEVVQEFLQGALSTNAVGGAQSAMATGGASAAFLSIFDCGAPAPPEADGGRTTVEAFWWGFHLQLSHKDLMTVLDAADTVNSLVVLIGGNIPSPAAPWIKLIGPFVAATHAALRALDKGRGIYISMSWVAPGVFVPTTV
jgi:hypothetical protein